MNREQSSYDKGKTHGIVFGVLLTVAFTVVFSAFFTTVALPFINGEGYYRGWTEATQELNLPSVGEINNMSNLCSELK